jgi:hypothetical protein
VIAIIWMPAVTRSTAVRRVHIGQRPESRKLFRYLPQEHRGPNSAFFVISYRHEYTKS